MTDERRDDLDFAPPRVRVRTAPSGEITLQSDQELRAHDPKVGDWLQRWASETPDRPFLAQRSRTGTWTEVSYRQALRQTTSLAQSLLDLGLGPERPLAVLSGNGISHALLELGALHAGIPVAPISPAYSLLSQDHKKLNRLLEILTPGAVFAAEETKFHAGLSTARHLGAHRIVETPTDDSTDAILVSELLKTRPSETVTIRSREVGPETIAKILFTSGSTGEPKGVLNTQRMLCSNQQAIAQLWPFVERRPPTIVDWLPWSHTFGSNHNFFLVLRNGGTLYIDEGKPVSGGFDTSLQNLREIHPTLYFNVPRGYEMLLPHLEEDEELRTGFFSRLDLLLYAGAALPDHLWERLRRIALVARGKPVPLVSAWGSTETAPMATSVHYAVDRTGNIGLPAPGTEIKLKPAGTKLSLWVRGPNVTPGYWRDPTTTENAFDREGFFEMGDAGRFCDPQDPSRGLEFDGRLGENFKLTSGTWVIVHEVRNRVLNATAPLVQDVAVAGENREEVGLLIFLNPAGWEGELPPDRGRGRIREILARGNEETPISSQRIGRFLILDSPPDLDAGEITDKGYLNQRSVLFHRRDEVDRLYRASDCTV